MKKLIGIMLAATMLVSVLAVSAFAVNAPLTAAEYFANRTVVEDSSTGGTIAFTLTTEPFLPAFSAANDNAGVWTMNSAGDDLENQIAIDDNEFDVIVKFTTAKNYAGARFHVFYNPDVVKPLELYDATVYTLIDDVNFNSSYDSIKDITGNMYNALTSYTSDSSADYAKYKSGDEDSYAVWQTQLLDGQTTMVTAGKDNLPALQGKKYELTRWPFEITATNNNWYRTKLIGSYDQFSNAVPAPISPVIADGGVMYYTNTNYTGPKFDIVGAMETETGDLRFGSVYFSGIDEAHDNTTTILDAGVILYPSELLEDTSLTLDTVGAVKISAAGRYGVPVDGEYTYTGILTGLTGYEDMYITARSFVKYMDGEDEVVVYSDPIARNLNMVDTEGLK